MTLGDVYSANSLGMSRDKINTLLSERSKGKQYTDLETKLNAIFYPDGSNSTPNFNQISTSYANKKQQDILEVINTIDYNTLDSYSKSTQKERISIETIKKAYEELKTIFGKIENSKGLADELQNKVEKLGTALKDAENVIKNLEMEMGEAGRTTYVMGDSFNSAIKTYNLLSGYLSFFQANENIQGELGRAFEKALTYIARYKKTWEKNIQDQMIDTAFSAFSRNTGGKVQSRGGSLNNTLGIYISNFSMENFDAKQEVLNMSKVFTEGDNTAITASIDSGVAKQIKMDVDLTVKDGKGASNYRISAKNWATASGSIGETYLLSALDRSLGGNTTITYGLTLLKKDSNLLQTAHDLARLAVLADIITGMSQTKGYADTLVINARSRSHIYVINPAQLISDYFKGKPGISIRGYKEQDLNDTAQNIMKVPPLNTISSPGRTGIYISSILSYLSTIKLSVAFNAATYTDKNKQIT